MRSFVGTTMKRANLNLRLLITIAALFLVTGTAHTEDGWSVGIWDCPDVSVDGARIELRKYAVHVMGLKIGGRFQVAPLRVEIKELPNGTVTFNGKRCHPVKKEEGK